MAIPKQARVIHTEKWNDVTCHIRCEMLSPPELGFVGGQYVIVDSGIQLPNGKRGKRAYSIASRDSDQRHFELVVRRIPGGVGSGFIHGMPPGQIFEFSGPWGKFLPPSETPSGEILVIATDTGLTAALGLIRGREFTPFLPAATLIWFLESDSYFMPLDLVHLWIPQGLREWRQIQAPAIGDTSRIMFCRNQIEEVVPEKEFTRIYLSGDGWVLSELKELFLDRGYPEEQILVETFFNHLELKAPSVQERRS